MARAGCSERERALDRAQELEREMVRPRTRQDCENGPRPCPYVACKHHLYLEVSPTTGTITLNFPDLEVWELEQSCALDVAASGAQDLAQTSALFNLTRERIRQIESSALAKLARRSLLRSACE